MASGKFKCTKCDRSFSMAAHLARHSSTIHVRGGRKTQGKKVAGRVGRPPGRKNTYPVAQTRSSIGGGARQLLSGMRAYHTDLVNQRGQLEAEISAIGAAMDAMGAAPVLAAAPAKRGRPAGSVGRAGSLKSYVAKVLSQRSSPMSPKAIAAKIVKAGHKSKAKDLTKAVSNALPQLKMVKKVGFGMYRMT